MIKLFVISLFISSSLIFSQESKPNTMELVDYLKSKYLGKTISLTYKKSFRKMSLKVKNVIEDEDGHFKLVLSDKSKATFVFQTSLARPLRNQETSKKYNMMQINNLKSQELINFAIKDTVGESSISSGSSSSLKNLEENMDMYFSKNNFTTSKEIIYTDLKTQKILEDFFVISPNGLSLINGKKISIIIKAEE